MNGRADKGNGVGSTAGYYMDMVTAYMDVTVEITNFYNECDMDYYMQGVAPWFTSLSGFLGMLVSLIEVIISDSEVAVYTAMSAAAYSRDQAGAGT